MANGKDNSIPVASRTCEGGSAVVLLPLSAYELSNLNEALNAAMRDGSNVGSPINVLNSGDWTGVLAQVTEKLTKDYAPHHVPNATRHEYRARANDHIKYLQQDAHPFREVLSLKMCLFPGKNGWTARIEDDNGNVKAQARRTDLREAIAACVASVNTGVIEP